LIYPTGRFNDVIDWQRMLYTSIFQDHFVTLNLAFRDGFCYYPVQISLPIDGRAVDHITNSIA